MSYTDIIKTIIIKSIEIEKEKHEIANAYVEIVSCGHCPFWHDCSNETACYDYICKKLEESGVL